MPALAPFQRSSGLSAEGLAKKQILDIASRGPIVGQASPRCCFYIVGIRICAMSLQQYVGCVGDRLHQLGGKHAFC
jgi:hypothetical protein